MDIFKSMRSLVMEDIENPESSKTSVTIQPPNPFPTPPASGSINSDFEKLDKSANDKLEAAITSVNPTAYKDFVDYLSTLADAIPSEDARYKTALNLLAKKGIANTSLISDLDNCIKAIESKNKEFVDASAKKTTERIGGRQAHIVEIEQSITQKTQQIAALQADIITLTTQKLEENNTMANETQLINQAKDRFTFVYNRKHTDLDAQKQKILSYK